jgi:hypothetical protein
LPLEAPSKLSLMEPLKIILQKTPGGTSTWGTDMLSPVLMVQNWLLLPGIFPEEGFFPISNFPKSMVGG